MAEKSAVYLSNSKIRPLTWTGFIYRKANRLLMWPLVALITCVIGWPILLADLNGIRKNYEQEALSDVAALSHSYAESLQRAIELVDQLMLQVRHGNRVKEGAFPLEDPRKEGRLPSASLFHITLADQNGVPWTSTAGITDSLKDDPVFKEQQAATKDALYISKPGLSALNGQTMIQLSRRLTNADGNFSGIVVVSVAIDYLTAGYDRAILGKYGFLGLVASDATVCVIRTGNIVRLPEELSLPSSPALPARNGAVQLNGNTWFSDKRDRYIGWNTLDAYPLVAMVGLDKKEALSSYQINRALALNSAIWATAALFFFAILAMTLSLRSAWRKERLDLTEASYQMATESGTEGLFIGQPILDADGAVVDVLLADCNQRAAGFLRRRREEVIGKTVLALYEGRSAAKFMEPLRKALYTGSFEGEFEVSDDSPLTLDWIHLKVVRSNGDIAITVRDISDTKAHVAELERKSNEDALTGLPNRQWLQGYLPRAIDHAATSQMLVALLFLDLDGFKAVNDTMGHPAGDELLQNAAQRLKLAVRPHDQVVRLGGDEFVVLVEHVENLESVEHLADRILQAFRQSFRLAQGVASVGTSIGISVFPTHGADAETLIKHADVALYSVKASGKGDYAFFDEGLSEALDVRAETEAEFRHALEQDEFRMFYQPRVSARDGTILGMEALVCWTHPARGFVKPREFLQLAEKTGLIIEFGKLIFEKVCCEITDWKRRGKEPVPVSINVSHREFINVDMVEFLSATLARHRLPPALIQLEMKEQTATGADHAARQGLKAIQQAGIKLLVDNFGTGDLSISTLQAIAFDMLKVDYRLTSQVDITEEGKAFFTAVITMAHALGMQVVAEGVENETQARVLRDLGCDELQGYYISRPLPTTEVEAVLTHHG